MRQRFDHETIRRDDGVCAIEGSVEVFVNVWNDVTQDEALVA
jgi:hypothetical protein